MASEQDINKRLRSLHQDFDFLLDNNVISADLYDQLVEKIPRRWKRSDSVVAALPAPAPSRSSPPPASIAALATQMNAASISPAPVMSPPPPVAPPVNPTPPPAYGLAQAEALYDYHSTDEGDLNITAGQRITILEYVNNDWWRGEANGRQGIFPSNYVKKIEAPSQEKGAYPPPTAHYGYPGTQAQYQQPPQQPMYGAPAPYQAPPPQQQQEQPPPEKKQSRLGEFGKNYGKTFVNATAWGGGMALGSDVINSIL